MPVGPTIVVHGGTGEVPIDKMDSIIKMMKRAAAVGYDRMIKGDSADKAVYKAIKCLEDSEHFNVGGDGYGYPWYEHFDDPQDKPIFLQEASIMNGRTMYSGAIGTLSFRKNPIKNAYITMKVATNQCLVGSATCLPTRWLYNKDQPERIVEYRDEWKEKYSTVGAVACDCKGNVAAGASSGVPVENIPQRIGNSAIIGLGTWADNTVGAVSTSGSDESMMKFALAHSISLTMKDGEHPANACKINVEKLTRRLKIEAGAIAVSKNGEVGFATNAPIMPLAYITNDILHFGSSTNKIQTEPGYKFHLKRCCCKTFKCGVWYDTRYSVHSVESALRKC